MRRRRPGPIGCLLATLFLSAALGCSELRAQESKGGDVSGEALVEEARSREAGGDFAGAADLLARALELEPASIQALLAYERVLRVQGKVEGVLGAIERLLEVEPTSALGHQLRVRVLAELDRVEELESALEGWIRATPRLETPYREAASIWRGRGEERRALKVLEEGRKRLGRGDALALELGEVALALGDVGRAVREWDRAIGEDGRGFSLVRRRLGAFRDGGARVVPGLIEALSSSNSSVARQRVAMELAIGAGRDDTAERIARRVLKALPASARTGFLVEVARRADGAHLPKLAYWAYGALLEERLEHPLAIRGRLGALALELGDTATAREHFRVLEEAHAPGSEERRQAVAVQIELTAQRGEVDPAMTALQRFRQEFPDAPETDRLAALLADRLLDRGDREGAEGALVGVSGPRTGMLRGRLALLGGDPAAARSAFLLAAPQLEGAEATEAIALATLLRRLSPAGGAVLAHTLRLAGADSVAEGVGSLVERGATLERREYAALLDFAAGLADRAGLGGEAERIRRIIVTELPDSPEAAAALLALGRALAAEADRLEEARSYLERLLLEHPRSALVPQARRELDRLEGRLPSGGR